MSKLSQIEQKIRELVPSTMELTFGCEVKFGFSSARYCGEDNDWIYLEKLNVIQPTREIEKVGKSIKLKILGHPIQLHHIILAVINHKQRYLVKGYISGDRMNNFEAEILDLLARYDKTRGLHGQSEELCDFIHQLICK